MGVPRSPQGASSRDTGSPGRLWLDFSTACELSISTPSKTNASSGWPPGPPIHHHLIYIKALSPLITKTNKKSASIPHSNRQKAGGVRGLPAFCPGGAPGLRAQGVRRASPWAGRSPGLCPLRMEEEAEGSLARKCPAPLEPFWADPSPELTPAGLVLPARPWQKWSRVMAQAGGRVLLQPPLAGDPVAPGLGDGDQGNPGGAVPGRPPPHVWVEGSSWGRS